MPLPSLLRFFATPAEFRQWLQHHHTSAAELWVGFYKRHSRRLSITWPESVDEALCVGWIDSLRKRLDDQSYVIRFTPRKPTSTWSTINIKRITNLIHQGKVLPAGLKAFQHRSEKKSGIYSYEQRQVAKLDLASERRFRANKKAWNYFQTQAPSYRRIAAFWVMNAKKEETRQRRLAALIDSSANSRPIGPLSRPPKPN